MMYTTYRLSKIEITDFNLQRKQFLAEVLGSLNKDPVKQMLELIKIIQEEDTDDNVESKETALADLQMLCEDIDNATGTFICIV